MKYILRHEIIENYKAWVFKDTRIYLTAVIVLIYDITACLTTSLTTKLTINVHVAVYKPFKWYN